MITRPRQITGAKMPERVPITILNLDSFTLSHSSNSLGCFLYKRPGEIPNEAVIASLAFKTEFISGNKTITDLFLFIVSFIDSR